MTNPCEYRWWFGTRHFRSHRRLRLFFTLVSNVDIAPTLAELSRVPWQADGPPTFLCWTAPAQKRPLRAPHRALPQGQPGVCSLLWSLSFYSAAAASRRVRGRGDVLIRIPRVPIRRRRPAALLRPLRSGSRRDPTTCSGLGSGSAVASMGSSCRGLLGPNPATTMRDRTWPTFG